MFLLIGRFKSNICKTISFLSKVYVHKQFVEKATVVKELEPNTIYKERLSKLLNNELNYNITMIECSALYSHVCGSIDQADSVNNKYPVSR